MAGQPTENTNAYRRMVSRHFVPRALYQPNPPTRMALFGLRHFSKNDCAFLILFRSGKHAIQLDPIHFDEIVLSVTSDVLSGLIVAIFYHVMISKRFRSITVSGKSVA